MYLSVTLGSVVALHMKRTSGTSQVSMIKSFGVTINVVASETNRNKVKKTYTVCDTVIRIFQDESYAMHV